MNTFTPAVSPLRQRMIEDMRMRKLSTKTQAAYIRSVLQFARYLRRSPDTASVEDLRNYQLHLVDKGHLSDLPQRCDHRTQVLLRRHVGSRRHDGQDAAGVRATHAAGGAQP